MGLTIYCCVLYCLFSFYPTEACFDQITQDSIAVKWGYKGNVFGPVSGGTMILVHAPDGGLEELVKSGMTIVLTSPEGQDYPCTRSTKAPKWDNYTGFLTPEGDASDVGQDFFIQLKCPTGGVYYDLGRKFNYKPNPILDSEYNFKTIISGGIELTFRGENLLSAGFPIMMIYVEYEDYKRGTFLQKGCFEHDNSVQWCKQICRLRNDTEFFCRSPSLYTILPPEHGGGFKEGSEGYTGTSWETNFSTAPEMEINLDEISDYMSYLISTAHQYDMPDSTRRKRATYIGPEVLDVTVKIAMVLDGQSRGVNNSTGDEAFDLTVVKNPDFHSFDTKNFNPEFHKYEKTIRIPGEYVNSGSNQRDTTVTIGGNPCPIVGQPDKIGITCAPPPSLTNPTGPTEGGGYQAVVKIGYLSWSVGYIKYVRWYQSSVFIGIVVAAILIPLILVAAYFMMTRCMLPLCNPTEYPFIPGSVHSNVYDFDVLTKIGPDLSGRVQQSGLLLPENVTIKIVDRLGSGNFGVVYAGFLQRENSDYPDYVAIKTLKDGRDLDDEQLKEVFREALIMKDLDDPNVVKIIGIVIMQNQPHIIMPFLKNKDLRTHIRSSNNRFTVQDLLEYGIQIATGMSHVASKGIVHRDLAARNCMVSDEETIKVSDFGLARETNYRNNLYTQKSGGGGLPVRWMSLESLKTLTFDSKSDVWSFGVLLWELLTRGGHPYADLRNQDLKDFLQRGHRLHKPACCPSEIYKIMTSCWEPEPEDRPSFEQLVIMLTEATTRQMGTYADYSVLQSDGKQAPPQEYPYQDAYTVFVAKGGGTDRPRDSMPGHPAPQLPPGNNNIV